MKTRNLFLSLFAFAAVCACNKEEVQGTPEVLDADTYVKVNIMATPATKVNEAGLDEENEVYNGLFLFYTGEGVAVEASGFSWENGTDGNVAKYATVKFPAKTTKPTSMLVILNYDSDQETNYRAATLSEIKNLVSKSYSIQVGSPADTYYTMTNSVYTEDSANSSNDEAVICEVSLTDANFGKADAENGTANAPTPVNVYVERVAAKVLLVNSIASTTTSTIDYDGNPSTVVTPVIIGYDVVETPNKGNLFKAVDPSWNFAGWTVPASYRSYWAKTPALIDSKDYVNGDYDYKDYKSFTENINPIYLFENTSATTTKVVLTAKLQIGGVDADIVRYNNTYYSMDDFKALAATAVNTICGTSYTGTEFNPVYGDAASLDNNYEIILKHPTNSEANNVLKNMTALYWNQGRCYYYTDIMHDIPNQAGVVRNHVYKLTFNSLKGMGIPVPHEDVIIDPENLDDEYYSLNATVNILQWKVVTQNVSFDNN